MFRLTNNQTQPPVFCLVLVYQEHNNVRLTPIIQMALSNSNVLRNLSDVAMARR